MRPRGAIFQTVDIFTLQVKNEETFEPLPFVKFTNASTQDLEAQTESRAAVRPKDYRVAGIKMDAPPKTPGRKAAEWDTTGVHNGCRTAIGRRMQNPRDPRTCRTRQCAPRNIFGMKRQPAEASAYPRDVRRR